MAPGREQVGVFKDGTVSRAGVEGRGIKGREGEGQVGKVGDPPPCGGAQ
jgi:hypothetical protein